MRLKLLILNSLFILSASGLFAQKDIDPRVREYIAPHRVVWKYSENGAEVNNSEVLLKKGIGQAAIGRNSPCVMKSADREFSSLLLDFGKELQGGIRIVTSNVKSDTPVKIRIRFGESVSEAMSSVNEKDATNDHAPRDYEFDVVPSLATLETGNTGFRFVRIDMLTPNTTICLEEVNAISVYRDVAYKGSFKSNDERLNTIWQTGAYTVHLNMQDYLWDGIKRDRLVWVGDMHPEVMTISTVFGYNEVVPKSLDLARDTTPLPQWMTGISAYSLWWIITQHDWYKYQGDLSYLKEQRTYLTALLHLFLTKVNDSGKEQLDGWRFLDWPSSSNQAGVDAGLQALLMNGLESGAYLCEVLGDMELAHKCKAKATLMKQYIPDTNDSKQAAALMSISGLADPAKMNNEVVAKGGVKNFSTFYGYYMLQAMAKANDYQGALNNIRSYWGGMLDMGATTFWEDFNVEWMENAAPIDELVPEGKKDIHGDYGDYCYKGLRHSLCHGWSSGPTSWLSEHVLGVKVIEPGCKVVKIEPHLGDLEWVEGTFPTPLGIIYIKHKMQNGKIVSEIKAPKGVKIIK